MQKRILIIIGLVLMLGVAVVLTVFVLNKNKSESNQNGNTNTINTVVSNSNSLNANKKELTEEEKQRIEIIRLANIFTERYGTYKGALTTDNVNSFSDLVTSAFLTQVKKQVNDALSSTATTRISTMVLSSGISSYTKDTGAVVTVSTLRTEEKTDGTINNKTSQSLTLGFFFLENAWKIQSAQWGTPTTAPSVNE